MQIVSLKVEPKCEIYEKILSFIFPKCSYFMIVLHNEPNPKDIEILNSLTFALIESKKQNRWPGTVLLSNKKKDIYKYQLNAQTFSILKIIGQDILFGVYALEDLSFLRHDGSPFFVSITHEKDFYFKLQSKEYCELVSCIGKDNLSIDGKDKLTDEHY